MADFGKDGVHPLRMNYKRGISDLVGQLKTGQFLACEVKREGAALMDHQREFLNEVLRNGGVAFVARSIEDAKRGLA
jgi:ABC-type transporter MlaC component